MFGAYGVHRERAENRDRQGDISPMLSDYLQAFDPMEWMTIGLLIFAGVQILVSHRADRRADRIERERDDREGLIAARTIFAESFRLGMLADRYDDTKVDLVAVSLRGLLDPGEMRVENPSLIAQLLGRLGQLSANIGITGITRASEAAICAAQFNEAVRSELGNGGMDTLRIGTSQVDVPRQRQLSDEQIASIARAMIENLQEAAGALEDAATQYPAWHSSGITGFVSDPVSNLGKDLKRVVEAKLAEADKDVTERSAPLSRLVSRVQRSLGKPRNETRRARRPDEH